MHKVVVNSTPIIALCNADLLYVLREMYGEIIIPKAVFDEVTAKKIPHVIRFVKIWNGLKWSR